MRRVLKSCLVALAAPLTLVVVVSTACSGTRAASSSDSRSDRVGSQPVQERRIAGPFRLVGTPVRAVDGLFFKLNRALPARRGGDAEIKNVQAYVQLGGDRYGYEDESVTYYRGRFRYRAALMLRYPDEIQASPQPRESLRLRIGVADEARAIVVRITSPESEQQGDEAVTALCGGRR